MSDELDNTNATRRKIVKACVASTSLVFANPAVLANTHLPAKQYQRVLLTGKSGEPLTSTSIEKNQCYVFHYPFVTTPCFLLNLGKPIDQQVLSTDDATDYQWNGGVGPGQSIVAFSAICAHKLSYPTKDASFINFRNDTVNFHNPGSGQQARQQVIYCCSERSVYDPAEGARVLGGPAPNPLTTVVLEYDADQDHFYATSTLGSEVYDRFFEKFEFRLALDHKVTNVKQLVSDISVVTPISEYSSNDRLC